MSDDHEKIYRIQEVEFHHEDDDLEPPPPGLVSKFKTINDWLINITETEHPETNCSNYNFGLFESRDDYVLFLVGLHTTEKEKNHSITRIVFEPANTYFPLPLPEHQGLSREQVIDKITQQLNSFLHTDAFKRSFLAKANSITTDFAGVIWPDEDHK